MNLFKLVGSIFVDNDEANESISKTDNSMLRLANGFVDTTVKVGKFGVKVATVAAAAAGAATAAIVKVADETRDYRTEMGKLETAFETSNHSGEVAKKTYKDLQSILGETEQATEAASHLAELCKTEEQLASWTDICTGVYGKFGVSIPIEGLTEAANETAKTGALTGGLADALNWAGVNEEAFQESLDKCNSEQERATLITETLNGLYSDSAEKYRENNKEIIEANQAQEKFNETMAKVGEAVEPIVSKVKEFGAMLLDEATPAIVWFGDQVSEKLDNAAVYIDLFKEGFHKAKEKIDECIDFVEQVVEDFENLDKWAEENSTSLTILGVVIGGVTAAIIAYNAAAIVKKGLDIAETAYLYALIAAENAHTIATTIATGATTAFGVAVSFLTSPITIVIGIITALIAVGVLLYKNWDTVKEKCGQLADGIKEKFDKIKKGVGDAMESAKETVKNVLDKIKGFFKFEWSLPKIKLPHITIKPTGWEVGDLLKGEIPKLGINWYKKAMDNPVMFTEPTIFDVTSSGVARAAGEAGAEIMVGKDTAISMIEQAVANQNGTLIHYLQKIIEILADYFPETIAALQNMVIILDDGTIVGRLAPAMSIELGRIKEREERGR